MSPDPRFVCDAMLAHVGKRLRMAGYDTLIDEGQARDREILDIAIDESRILLTCDKQIPTMLGAQPTGRRRVLYSASNDISLWARLLKETVGIDWERAPFTRCLVCNGELQAPPTSLHERLPENIDASKDLVLYCATCEKLYWDGTHVERMRTQLRHLKRQTHDESENKLPMSSPKD